MDEAAWRMTIGVPDERAEELREHVAAAAGGLDLGSNDESLFVYAPTREGVERALPHVRSGLDRLAIVPTTITVDRWLEDEQRWSSEPPGEADDAGRGSWLDAITHGLPL